MWFSLRFAIFIEDYVLRGFFGGGIALRGLRLWRSILFWRFLLGLQAEKLVHKSTKHRPGSVRRLWTRARRIAGRQCAGACDECRLKQSRVLDDEHC